MAYTETREDVVARIKEQADIVEVIGQSVELKRSGVRHLGLCPFHGEKTPSFSVNAAQQFYHCFGCGESGDVFSFMMKYHNLDFPEAVKELARRYQIALPERQRSPKDQQRAELRKKMYDVNLKAMTLYRQYLLEAPEAKQARAYLASRKISSEILTKYNIGYAPSVEAAGWEYLGSRLNSEERAVAEKTGLQVRKEGRNGYDRFRDRIMFPIYDLRGRVCGFGGRIVGDGQPKYMNSPESEVYDKSNLLLGLFQGQESIRKKKRALMVEGNFDLLSLVVHGCDNVVAPLGTALTRQQLKLLKRFSEDVILLFDGDDAGVKAATRAVPFFLNEQINGKVALLPTGHDPDTFIQEKGKAELDRLLDKAMPLPEFMLEQLIQEHGLTLNGKNRIVQGLKPLVEAAASPLHRSVIVSHFGEQLGIAPEQLNALLGAGPREAEPIAVPPSRPQPNAPLTIAQKRLVHYMVLHPDQFARLEEAGIRAGLAGSVGEVIFLQMQSLKRDDEQLDPEELLAMLPEGAERKLVSEILLAASSIEVDDAVPEDGTGDEAAELVEWLRRDQLQRASATLLEEIITLQHSGNEERLLELFQEKQKIDRELQNTQ